MAITASGAISLNDLHVEAGGSSGSTCSFNDTDIRDILEKSSGASHSLGDYYSKKAPFTGSGTVGATNVYNAGSEYVPATNNRYRGYNSNTYGSNYPSGTSYGTLSPIQDSDYLSNNQVIACASSGNNTTGGSITGNVTILLRVRNISGSAQNINTDANFKKLIINGNTFNRSDATYTSGGVDGIPSTFTWNATNQTIPNDQTSVMHPFPAPGQSYTAKFRGQ